jgi:hypothetical protein
MTLSRQVVDLIRLDLADQASKLRRIGEVSIVKKEAHPFFVRISIEMIDTMRIESGGAADHPVHLVSLLQEEFG